MRDKCKSSAEVAGRKNGYYWVKIHGDFRPAQYVKNSLGEYWWMLGVEETYKTIDFEEIDEKQICRN